MAFCDYCKCEDCKTGVPHYVDGNGKPVNASDLPGRGMLHAPTEFGDWICSTCFHWECCVDWQEILGEKIDPCTDKNCGHRPKLVGPFVPLEPQP